MSVLREQAAHTALVSIGPVRLLQGGLAPPSLLRRCARNSWQRLLRASADRNASSAGTQHTHTHTHAHIHAQKHIQMSVLIDTGSSNFAIASSPQRHLHKIFNTSRFHTIHQRLNLHHPLIFPTTQFSRLTTSSHPPQLLLLQTRAPENLCVVCTRLLDWLPRCLSHKLS